MGIFDIFKKKDDFLVQRGAYYLSELSERRDKEYKANSHTKRDTTYKVNIYQMTCTCPDFEKYRSQYTRLDARRMCKHMAQKIDDFCCRNDELVGTDLAVVRTACRHSPPTDYVQVRTRRGKAILAYYKDRDWVNVITVYSWPKDAVRYRRYDYGYNLDEKRWAYDEMPENHVEIEKIVRRIPASA